MASVGFSSKKTKVKKTYRNEKGQTVRIIQVWGKSVLEVGSRSHQGYILEVDGEKVAYTGASRIGLEWGGMQKVSTHEDMGNLLAHAKDSYGDKGILLSEGDYKAFKESEEVRRKLEREVQMATILTEEAGEKTSELAQLEASKVSSETAGQLHKALLATGQTPEEAEVIANKAIEASGDINKQIAAASGALVANTTAQIGASGIGNISTTEDLKLQKEKIGEERVQFGKTLASTIDAAKIAASSGKTTPTDFLMENLVGPMVTNMANSETGKAASGKAADWLTKLLGLA